MDYWEQRWANVIGIIEDRTPEYVQKCIELEKLIMEHYLEVITEVKKNQKKNVSRGCGGIIDMEKLRSRVPKAPKSNSLRSRIVSDDIIFRPHGPRK